jgi:hypothetical protein
LFDEYDDDEGIAPVVMMRDEYGDEWGDEYGELVALALMTFGTR